MKNEMIASSKLATLALSFTAILGGLCFFGEAGNQIAGLLHQALMALSRVSSPLSPVNPQIVRCIVQSTPIVWGTISLWMNRA